MLERETADLILEHTLQGMDAHYLAPDEDSLKEAMDRYTEWLDGMLDIKNEIRKVKAKI